MITNIVLLIWVMQANGGLPQVDSGSTSQSQPLKKLKPDELQSMY